MITVGRGYRQQHSILKPANNGIAVVANNRLMQAVGQQNANHIEALKVDGVPCPVFIKNFSGKKCSCCKDLNKLTSTGANESSFMSDFTVDERDDDTDETFLEFPQSKTSNTDDVIEDEPPLTEDLLEEYALKDDNSLIFGGDKTPCGICFGAGYKDSYSLFNGQRIVLDYYDNPELFGFKIENTAPLSFSASYSSDNYIKWKVKLPTYFMKFLGLRVRNNLSSCSNYDVFISFDDINFVKYEDSVFQSRQGQDSIATIKVIPRSMNNSLFFTLTHIELFYQFAEFPYADFKPIQQSENWEYFEALKTTEIEFAGDIRNVNRESVILDTKNALLWKVVSVTPHYTVNRQLFKQEIDLRMIQPSEALYCLYLIQRPFVEVVYRGLEQKQGMKTYLGEFKE